MEIQTAGRQTERNRQKNNVDSPTDSTYTYCTVHGQAGKQTSRQIVVLLPDLPTPALPKTASFISGLFAMAAGSNRNQNGLITEPIVHTAGFWDQPPILSSRHGSWDVWESKPSNTGLRL